MTGLRRLIQPTARELLETAYHRVSRDIHNTERRLSDRACDLYDIGASVPQVIRRTAYYQTTIDSLKARRAELRAELGSLHIG